MNRIKTTWREIVRVGCTGSIRGLERSQIMMVNGLSASMIIVVTGFLTFYIVTGISNWPNWLPAYPLFASVLLLNRSNKIKLARITFFWGCLALIFSWSILNRRNGAEYGLIALGVSSALLFKRKISIYFGAFSVLAAIISYKAFDYLTPFVPNPTFDYNIVPNVILCVSVGIVFFEVMVFKGLARHYYKKLGKKYNVLEEVIEEKKKVEEELGVANEELKTSNEALNSLTDQLDQIVKQKSLELQSYLDAINVHIYSAITDTKGTIIKVNDPLIKVTGYSKEELIANNFRLLNSGHHTSEFYSNLYNKITNGEIWRDEIRNKAKNGSFFWIDQVILPIKNEKGVLSYFLMLALPITERKKIEEERAHTMEIFESITHKTSHDIRGPLARMMGLSTLLKRDMINEEELTFVAHRLLESSNELDVALHDLTTFIVNNHELFTIRGNRN